MEEVPRQDEDAVLLDAWRVRDDAAALERLVEKYRAPLSSLIFRYVGDVHEAEDCFQETWARVLPRLDAARAIAERHAAALRGLEAVKQRVAEAESHLPESVEREMDALLGRAVASDE